MHLQIFSQFLILCCCSIFLHNNFNLSFFKALAKKTEPCYFVYFKFAYAYIRSILFHFHTISYCCFFFLIKFFQGLPVTQNVSWGVIISTRSLVLQRVARVHAGYYACSAANDRGETQSALVNLRIRCKYDNLKN